MNRYLLFQLFGSMCSWGDVAVGESRVSASVPGRAAMLGLLAAALGVKRDQESQLQSLSADLCFGMLVLNPGYFLRDYHTAQVPPAGALKKRPARTRKDELSVPKDELGTILSSRDYRTDACYRIAVQASDTGEWKLEALHQALLEPVFPLYLGRKACPPALPLQPQIVSAESLLAAFQSAEFYGPADLLGGLIPSARLPRVEQDLYSLHWEDGMDAGQVPMKTTSRRDQPRTRRRWQFDERIEHQAMIESFKEAPCS